MADKYPDGKINQDDEGKLELKTVVYYEGRRDHVLGETGFMDRLYSSGERDAAKALIKNAEEAERQIAHLKPVRSFVIGGYTPGNPFDALILGYYEGEKLLDAAKVRNAFVQRVRREVASKFKGLEIDTCPFANLPERKRTQWALTKEEMKNCVCWSHKSSSPNGRRM
jgi:hypothetical protein